MKPGYHLRKDVRLVISSRAWIHINKPLQRKIRRVLDNVLVCDDPFVGVDTESKKEAVKKIMKIICKRIKDNPFN